MKHIPKKRFGQHFLTDGGIIDAIVQAINPQPGQPMLEIGPGLGALTQPLVRQLGQLTVVELDRDLAERLRKQKKLFVIEADILNVNIVDINQQLLAINNNSKSDENNLKASSNLPKSAILKWRIVGNLPYNISSPILFHLLNFVDHIEDQHFMLQKEVIDRMVAHPATAAYGRMSVMLQWRYAMENVLHVPPASFAPPPRVDSAVVRMVPRQNPAPLDPKHLEEVVKVAFSQRRKLMRHTLGKWLSDKNFAGEFDLQRRAEEVPVAEFVALAQAV